MSRNDRPTRRFPLPILPAVATLAAVLLLAAPPARAAMETYTIDPEHTNVGFRISHLVFSKVSGRFDKVEGTIALDPSDLTKGSVEVSIDTSSIDTNEPARDKHLRSDAFFDVAKNPKLTFQSVSVKQAAPNKLQVAGNLTIRGTTKPVTLDAEYLGVVTHPQMGTRMGLSATGEINKDDFGVSFNAALETGGFVLGKTIRLEIEVEAVLKS